jgi:hypothetical protein
MSHDVFISYSTQDKATADAACAALESRGVRCWIAPRDVLPGRNWGEAIIDAISQAKVMVLVYSAHANASTQVQREVERAASKDVVIVPFRVENAPLGKAMEYFLSSPHWLDAFPPPADQYFGRLVETVQRLLNAGGVAAPTVRSGATPVPGTRASRRLAPVGVLALVVLSCVAAAAVVFWRHSHPNSPGNGASASAATRPATTGPALTLADLIPLKSQADVAYERAQKYDRANGMGEKFDQTEPTRRTAQAYLDAKDYAQAKQWYESLLAQLKEVARDEADRAEAQRLIAQAAAAGDAAKAAGADPSADSWANATEGLAHARELVEVGDFYKARVRAWAAGEEYDMIRVTAAAKQGRAQPAAE